MSSTLNLLSLLPRTVDCTQVLREDTQTTFVGIDFGTSTTVASYAVYGEDHHRFLPRPIPIPQTLPDGRTFESHLLPSAIAWHNGRLLVGQGAHALKNRLTKDRDVWFSFKMELGVDLGPQYCNSILDGSEGGPVIQTPRQAATVLFSYLRKHIEAFVDNNALPKNIAYSVSIPASFEANQRYDLMQALKDAGIPLPNQAFIDEPNAAFISYMNDCVQGQGVAVQVIPDHRPFHVLVFDFGAGTCDISLLQIVKNDLQLLSKNLAISRFQRLGGDDIDRQIVSEVLIPQLLDDSKAEIDDFREAEIRKIIAPRLVGTAENLKIRICRSVEKHPNARNRLPPVATSDRRISEGSQIRIETPDRTLVLYEPSLTYQQFANVMKSFLADEDLQDPLAIPEDQPTTSIFTPVNSALDKAGLDPSDIDLVLLIGGSSCNPYVQSALVKYFTFDKVQLPSDPQAHVSAGAALNSFLVNGLQTTLIRPILSESIFLVTRDAPIEVLPAGSEMPCVVTEIGNLHTESCQPTVELPLYVTSQDKLLTVFRLTPKNGKTFPRGEPIHFKCSLNEDKMLTATATIAGHTETMTQVNPYANRELSFEERKVLEAEREANISAVKNGGPPDINALDRLVSTCVDARHYLRAAETLEVIQRLVPSRSEETDICFYYDKADKHKKSRLWARKAFNRNPNAINAFNLALDFEDDNPEEFARLMEQSLTLDRTAFYAMHAYGAYLAKQPGGKQRGVALLNQALTLMVEKMNDASLSIHDCPRLISCADLLGDVRIGRLAKAYQAELEARTPWYKYDNLVSCTRNDR